MNRYMLILTSASDDYDLQGDYGVVSFGDVEVEGVGWRAVLVPLTCIITQLNRYHIGGHRTLISNRAREVSQ